MLSFQNGLFSYCTETLELVHYPFAYPSPADDSPSINQAFFRDEAGIFYIMTNNGLVVLGLEEGIIRTISRDEIFNNKVSAGVNQLIQVGDTLWFASRDLGVVSYHPETGERIFFDLKQSTRISLEPNNALAIACSRTLDCKYLWVASARSGLYKIDTISGELTFITNLTLNQAGDFRGMLIDEEGALWISLNIGIIRYYPETDTATRFTMQDGLQSINFSRLHFLGYPDGHMLFCSFNGCNRFHPRDLKLAAAPKKVVFTDILLKGTSVLPYSSGYFVKDDLNRPELRVNWRDQVLRFRFAALSFAPQGHNRYKYRLSPNLNDWIEIGSLTELSLTNLDPGLHTLKIKGGDSDGNWSAQAAVLPITVIPPFWMTFTFRASLILLFTFLIAGLSWGVTRQRYKARLRQLEYKLAVDQERLRISRDMHDNIGSKLTLIKMLREQLNSANAGILGTKLDTLTQVTTEIMRAMSEIVWALNPKNDSLENLAGFMVNYADSFCRKCEINFRVQAPEAFPEIIVPSPSRHHLLNILKEALNNAVRHSDCTVIYLQLSLDPDKFLFHINLRDNGTGFDPKHPANTFGNGLTSMQDRIRECGGTLQLESIEGTGTEIRVSCPIGKNV